MMTAPTRNPMAMAVSMTMFPVLTSVPFSAATTIPETIARMINNFLPGMLEENRVTLAYLITGIVGSKEVQLRQVTNKVVYPGKETSLVERFRRFIRNQNIVVKVEFNPFVGLILSSLSRSRLPKPPSKRRT